VKVLLYAGFTASLVSTIRQPSTLWVVITVVLGVASAAVLINDGITRTTKSG
jgi:hypothetical protein